MITETIKKPASGGWVCPSPLTSALSDFPVSCPTEEGFLIPILDLVTLGPKYVILTSGIHFLSPNYSRKIEKNTYLLLDLAQGTI